MQDVPDCTSKMVALYILPHIVSRHYLFVRHFPLAIVFIKGTRFIR